MVKTGVYYDAEWIPEDQFERIYRLPPSMPKSIDRSCLLVGARGAGKTAYLRYIQRRNPKCAVRLDCLETLASIARRTDRGPYFGVEAFEENILQKGFASYLLTLKMIGLVSILNPDLESTLHESLDLFPIQVKVESSSQNHIGAAL